MSKPYFVYILVCSDKSFYTGIAIDLEQRLATHNSGAGSKYVRTRLPAKIVYSELHPDKASAARREYEIKQLTREQKMLLIGNGG